MNILALETSLPHASLCLYRGQEVVFHTQWEAARNHDAHLFPALQQALEHLNEERLDLILVGSGPGSYGGVRVALAAAVGISQVTDAQVVAIGSWIQLAQPGYIVVSDARRGGWTVRQEDGHIDVLNDEQLLELQHKGIKIATIETPGVMQQRGFSPNIENLVPTAEGLVHSWLSLSAPQQQLLKATPPEPIYVRPPHITKALRKPWEVRR